MSERQPIHWADFMWEATPVRYGGFSFYKFRMSVGKTYLNQLQEWYQRYQ